MTGYRARHLAPRLAAALEDMPVVVLTGARQTGKSTLLQHDVRFAGRRYMTLDDFAVLEAARRDPEGLLGDDPVTIDEAQRAPELLPAIKRAVDRRRRAGRFLLSGSASVGLLHGVGESLAGRAVTFALDPMSVVELAGETRPPLLGRLFGGRPGHDEAPNVTFAEVVRGGFPTPALGHVKNRELWFRGYEQTYLERDVRELTAIGDLVPFRSVCRLAASRTSQILNTADLARDAHVSPSTAARYLGVLEASFLVRRLPPFLGNRASRIVKAPKVYFADSGLAAYLAGVREASDRHAGSMLETFVLANLSAIAEAHLDGAKIHYWNIQGRYEVDFVIERGRDTVAIEVKAGTRWGDGDLRPLRAFLDATPDCKAAVLAYGGEATAKLGDRLWAIPLGALLR